MKQIGVSLFFWMTCCTCVSQVADSVSYPEVTVVDQRIKEAVGASIAELDTVSVQLYRNRGLRQLLELEAFISTRSYGPGGIANFSIRGSGSQHTQVVWEGIPINDPMLGQTDLAAISLAGISNAKVHYGAAGLTNNSGGIGGTLELLTIPERTKDGIDVTLEATAGSFGTYGVQFQLRHKHKRIFGTTSLEYFSARNNFTFTNLASIAREEKEMTHAAVERIGVTRSMGIHINDKNSMRLNFNYSQASRELPPTMLMAQTNEELFDRDIWAVLNWKRFGEKSVLSVSGSYLYGKQEYLDNNNYAFHHLYQANKNVIRYKLDLGFNLHLEVGADIFNEHARSDSAYRGETNWRYWQAAFAALKYVPKRWVEGEVLIREDLINGRFSPVQGMAGVIVKPTKWFRIKGNVARNFRAPTMNDFYWVPGGNPDLENESGFSWEAGAVFSHALKNARFELSVTYFQSDIDNWIIWLPLDGIWTPQNKRAVQSRGVETAFRASVKTGKVLFRLNASHTWVSSKISEGVSENDASVGKQLIYVPGHQAKGQLSMHVKGLFVLYGHLFVGERFTTSDNESSLEAYQLGYLSLGYEHQFGKRHRIGINCTIDNLFNTEYQTIAWRPMPGRSFLFNLNYKFQ
jgi:iron complex outermembrane receptor protein